MKTDDRDRIFKGRCYTLPDDEGLFDHGKFNHDEADGAALYDAFYSGGVKLWSQESRSVSISPDAAFAHLAVAYSKKHGAQSVLCALRQYPSNGKPLVVRNVLSEILETGMPVDMMRRVYRDTLERFAEFVDDMLLIDFPNGGTIQEFLYAACAMHGADSAIDLRLRHDGDLGMDTLDVSFVNGDPVPILDLGLDASAIINGLFMVRMLGNRRPMPYFPFTIRLRPEWCPVGFVRKPKSAERILSSTAQSIGYRRFVTGT